jgi:S1-C subfamily serine protease
MKLYPALLLAALALVSCVSYSVQENSTVQNVDSKILEEFEEHRENGDFYGSARSYIEFMICCQDERVDELRNGLSSLYGEKMKQFKGEGNNLALIEHTYSYINLLDDHLSDDDRSTLEGDIATYIGLYIEADLKGMGGLEKASWLTYLDRFAVTEGAVHIRSSLANLFLQRNNPVLSQKYLDLLSASVEQSGRNEEAASGEYDALVDRVAELQSRGSDISEVAIENAVKSSVKIIVDRGIKTEGGVVVPDQALGTGIVIDSRGYILTNHHIIESDVDPTYEGYSRVYVIPGKDENIRFVARVVGYDEVFDLALLKVEKQLESRIMIGDSDTLRQGEKVVAIGNPVGLTNTVTSGIVSSTDRPYLQIGGVIQIDAALNPGNSGGALIDNDGYLVGIAFAGLANFENLNFAIPSKHMLSILGRLYAGDRTGRSWIGCSLDEGEEGLTIAYIVPNSPAEVSGLEIGDTIHSVNGKQVSTLIEVQDAFSNLNSPMIGTMEIGRDGERIDRKVYLIERPVYPALYIYERDAKEKIITPLYGMILSKIEQERKKVYVVSKILRGSVANSAGIAEGDVVKIRDLKYDEEGKVFYLIVELKSKRFGNINKSMVLYRYVEVNAFI